jgi:hypothetical protein
MSSSSSPSLPRLSVVSGAGGTVVGAVVGGVVGGSVTGAAVVGAAVVGAAVVGAAVVGAAVVGAAVVGAAVVGPAVVGDAVVGAGVGTGAACVGTGVSDGAVEELVAGAPATAGAGWAREVVTGAGGGSERCALVVGVGVEWAAVVTGTIEPSVDAGGVEPPLEGIGVVGAAVSGASVVKLSTAGPGAWTDAVVGGAVAGSVAGSADDDVLPAGACVVVDSSSGTAGPTESGRPSPGIAPMKGRATATRQQAANARRAQITDRDWARTILTLLPRPSGA